MLKRVLAAGLLAGLVAGLAMAVLQHFTTVPLIMAAEAYEETLVAPLAESAIATHDHGAAAAGDHDAAAWAPGDGLERTLSTTVATIVSAVGFALVLIAVLVLANERITPRTALAYAMAAFAATGLATGLGLAPELPGSAAAALGHRQVWWFGTAIATAAGLWLILKAPMRFSAPVGVLLLVAPHAIGAPHAEGYASAVPAELAAHFAATSLVVHAVFWAMIGGAVGFFWQRLERT